MSEDAKFEDGAEKPLNLGALGVEDLQVISGLVQDSVFPITEMQWDAGARRLVFLLNRFRWEDEAGLRNTRVHPPERVRSLLVIDNVLKVASQGVDRSDKETILSVLSLTFDAKDDGAGFIELTLAGDGAIRASVEALEVSLKDVTRPYVAPSRSVPGHPD